MSLQVELMKTEVATAGEIPGGMDVNVTGNTTAGESEAPKCGPDIPHPEPQDREKETSVYLP
jgi:hypothetical protein